MNVGAYEAETHLSQLLDRVEAGEVITVTRCGRLLLESFRQSARRRRPRRVPCMKFVN
jgi:antitoxin (DNA-binding transcriptional repressor) of toxin-antitoxin stability system